MKIIKAGKNPPDSYESSIFLAGPTPRNSNVESWRGDVIKELSSNKYKGVVFVPEGDFYKENYNEQVGWENKCLNMADCILFWIPRSIDLPGFTTNVEYGNWMKSGKCVLGYPDSAEKVRYLKQKAIDYFIPVSSTIKSTVKNALKMIEPGSLREKGERCIPLSLWKTKSFQNWYKTLKEAGNKIDDAKILWTFRVGSDKSIIFSWIIKADIHVTKENRNKSNEFVFSRTDISTVMAYYPAEKLKDTEILMVKEFRSPCSNSDGFVHELPGGSSKDSNESITNTVVNELIEETGLKINKNRFKYVQSRQLASTLSAHKSHLFYIELNDDEIEQLRKNAGKRKGLKSDSERTYIELVKLSDVIEKDIVDWSMLGMIMRIAVNTEPKKGNNKKDWVGEFLG